MDNEPAVHYASSMHLRAGSQVGLNTLLTFSYSVHSVHLPSVKYGNVPHCTL